MKEINWFGLVLVFLSFVGLIFLGRSTIRYNKLIGFLKVSDKEKTKIRAWVNKKGGYNPNVHTIAIYLMIFCFVLLICGLLIITYTNF